MKKLKELYKRYEAWEVEDFHIELGYFTIITNNITAVLIVLVISVMIVSLYNI